MNKKNLNKKLKRIITKSFLDRTFREKCLKNKNITKNFETSIKNKIEFVEKDKKNPNPNKLYLILPNKIKKSKIKHVIGGKILKLKRRENN